MDINIHNLRVLPEMNNRLSLEDPVNQTRSSAAVGSYAKRTKTNGLL